MIYAESYLANWQSHGSNAPDFLVGPVGPSVAPRHDTAKYWGYTAIFNLLDYPSCTFPTGTFCDPQLHLADSSYMPRDNEFDEYNWKNYDPDLLQGAPVSLLVTGRKWDCERVLKAADFLASVIAS
jgi:Asp-tRNA(Asn)/Glu-tRNA(Gln) amidotransferase A subunit family amidase